MTQKRQEKFIPWYLSLSRSSSPIPSLSPFHFNFNPFLIVCFSLHWGHRCSFSIKSKWRFPRPPSANRLRNVKGNGLWLERKLLDDRRTSMSVKERFLPIVDDFLIEQTSFHLPIDQFLDRSSDWDEDFLHHFFLDFLCYKNLHRDKLHPFIDLNLWTLTIGNCGYGLMKKRKTSKVMPNVFCTRLVVAGTCVSTVATNFETAIAFRWKRLTNELFTSLTEKGIERENVRFSDIHGLRGEWIVFRPTENNTEYRLKDFVELISDHIRSMWWSDRFKGKTSEIRDGGDDSNNAD